jgi:hypothetical protein
MFLALEHGHKQTQVWTEVTGEWRQLHKDELRELFSSPSMIRIIKWRRMRWVAHVARMGEKRNACRLLVGKRPLGRRRRRWLDNIMLALVEVGWGDVDWLRIGTGEELL